MTREQKSNKLIHEKSPYLLQHAYNPVNWYPWGEAAFEKAQAENKPVFLSIGYSTCHWCHVMAHESFEDEEVAALLNTHYIAIKVDREERQDIDSVYMKVCQMMTGHGGWPLTVFLTPDKVPFYAGTYFPRESMHGLPGIMDVLTQLHEKYTADPGHIEKVTDSVTAALKNAVQEKSDKRLTKEAADEVYAELKQQFDPIYGGFGAAPKFPQPQNLLFLLRYHYFTGEQPALHMAESALKAMAEGGIYDHVGFGFARYATDREWLVPHFEKMLYDNALLLIAYTECWQLTGNPLYEKISRQIFTFINREMTSPDGAFYSAIDADAEGVEGKYYVWGYDEIFSVLGQELGELYTKLFDISPDGNFEGSNIPSLIGDEWDNIVRETGLTAEQLQEKVEQARQKLLEAREQRVYPHVDDKILTAWNGLMIAALAKAGKVFAEPDYTAAAEKALGFIEANLFQNGRLMARWREEETKYKAYLDDYAYLLWAYTELYENTFHPAYLKKGKILLEQLISLFWDEQDGGFFFTGKDSETLITKEKEIYDGALPSGNGVAAVMLTKMAYLTGETAYLDKTETMYFSFYGALDGYAAASPFFMQSLLLTAYPTKEVVVIGAADDPERTAFLQKLEARFLPDVTILAAGQPGDFAETAPFAANYRQIDGKTSVYICENFACQQPTTDLHKALEEMQGAGTGPLSR